MAGLCSSKHGPVLFTVLKNLFVWMFCSHVKTLKLMAGPRSPTSPVTAQLISRRWRLVSFCGCADFNNVQMNGWSCFLKDGRTHFTVLKDLFLWLVWSFSKTFELVAGPCFPKHGPVPFTVLKNGFVWMLCTHVKTFKFMAGPCSPTSPVTAQLFSRRWRIVSFWCCATFNNVQMNGWWCFPKHCPAHFTVLTTFFIWMVWSFSKTFELKAGLCSPKHGPVPFTVLKNDFVWMLNV